MADLFFSDAEVDDLCAGLMQDAAKVRYLKRLGLRVDRKPNGRPLAWRPGETAERDSRAEAASAASAASVVIGLQAWAKERHGKKA